MRLDQDLRTEINDGAIWLIPVGTPTFEQWLEASEFINKSAGAVHFWIGDWLNYGEPAWGERYSQALDATRNDYQTLRNDKRVASCIPPERRIPQLSFTHLKEVADLEPEDQDRLLAIARDQHLSYEKFRKVVRLDGQTLEDRELSPRGDKSPAQELIETLIKAQQQIILVDRDRLTDDDQRAIAGPGHELLPKL